MAKPRDAAGTMLDQAQPPRPPSEPHDVAARQEPRQENHREDRPKDGRENRKASGGGERAARERRKRRRAGLAVHGSEGRFEPGAALVDDPLQPGAKLRVAINLREAPLEHLYARGKIDAAEKLAGDWFRAVYERAAIGSARAIDLARPRVDGGRPADPLLPGTAVAAIELTKVRAHLGKRTYGYLAAIVGQGRAIRDVAAAIDKADPPSRQTLEHVGYTLRFALKDVIEYRGVGRGAAPR